MLKNALIILGAPLWIPLLIAVGAVFLSLFIVLWSLLVSLWAILATTLIMFPCAIVTSVMAFTVGNGLLSGIALISIGIFSIGLSIFLFFACRAATKGIYLLTERTFFGIANIFKGGRYYV